LLENTFHIYFNFEIKRQIKKPKFSRFEARQLPLKTMLALRAYFFDWAKMVTSRESDTHAETGAHDEVGESSSTAQQLTTRFSAAAVVELEEAFRADSHPEQCLAFFVFAFVGVKIIIFFC